MCVCMCVCVYMCVCVFRGATSQKDHLTVDIEWFSQKSERNKLLSRQQQPAWIFSRVPFCSFYHLHLTTGLIRVTGWHIYSSSFRTFSCATSVFRRLQQGEEKIVCPLVIEDERIFGEIWLSDCSLWSKTGSKCNPRMFQSYFLDIVKSQKVPFLNTFDHSTVIFPLDTCNPWLPITMCNAFVLNPQTFSLIKVTHLKDCAAFFPIYEYISPNNVQYSVRATVHKLTFLSWSKINMSSTMQDRAVRIIHTVNYRERTNRLFIKSGLMTLKTLLVM